MDSDALFDCLMQITTSPKSKVSVGEPSCSGSEAPTFTSSSSLSSSSGSVNRSQKSSVSNSGRETRSDGSLDDKNTEFSDKQSKRQKLMEEKAAKKVQSEFNKMYKPGECMKYMKVEIDKTLSEAWYMADVVREVTAIGSKVCLTSDMFHKQLVMWTRDVQPVFAARDGQLDLTSPSERCDHAVYILPADEVATHVAEKTLAKHLEQIKNMSNCRITLIVFGVKDYFKKSGRSTVRSNPKLMTEIELEMAIADALVKPGCDTIMANTPNEIALTIAQFTKAIAEAPHKKAKRLCDEQAEFYMRGDNKKCVPVDKDGHGLSRLWQQMVAVLPSSSLETSRTLCSHYKSPLALFQALKRADGVNELSNLGVSRAAVPGSRARRLGPEFAKKMHLFLTSTEGSVLLD